MGYGAMLLGGTLAILIFIGVGSLNGVACTSALETYPAGVLLLATGAAFFATSMRVQRFRMILVSAGLGLLTFGAFLAVDSLYGSPCA